MCRVCKDVQGKPQGEAVEVIACAVRRRPSKHLDALLGRVLGEVIPDEDAEGAERWERARRQP